MCLRDTMTILVRAHREDKTNEELLRSPDYSVLPQIYFLEQKNDLVFRVVLFSLDPCAQ